MGVVLGATVRIICQAQSLMSVPVLSRGLGVFHDSGNCSFFIYLSMEYILYTFCLDNSKPKWRHFLDVEDLHNYLFAWHRSQEYLQGALRLQRRWTKGFSR